MPAPPNAPRALSHPSFQAWSRWSDGFALVVASLLVVCVAGGLAGDETKKTDEADKKRDKEDSKTRKLFDGKTLEGWKVTRFGGEGEVHVEDGEIWLESGSPLTGITYKGELPKVDYELSLEGKKLAGSDFFCALTFPFGDTYCSFVCGGWGGAVVGISSIDGKDASQNETTKYMKFEKDRWYKIRVRVTAKKLEAWIGDEKMVDQNVEGRKITTRREVDLSKPLGISAYETRAALRQIQIRPLAAP